MSLEEFGAGVSIDQPNKEDRDNVELSRWLAGPDVDVYWDRSKSYGFGTFTTGLRRTPDLVIDGHNRTYAVEVKPPDDNGTVREGLHQAQQYWKDIESGRAEYKLGSEPTEIDAVLTATRNSPAGHLFKNDNNKDPKITGRSRGGQEPVKHGHCPQLEHAATGTAVRMAYLNVRQWCDDHDRDEASTGYGYLASMCLDGGMAGLKSTPATFFLRPKDGHRTHNWQSIPWHKKDG